jgi:HPt (histidine-containing phosphotransfer) domain-containing protein
MHPMDGILHGERSGPESTLDLEALERLTFGDRRLQERLLTSFLREISGLRAGLAGSQETEEFREELHRLEGSCHFIQAPRLLQAVRQRRSAGLEGRRAAMERIGQELDLAEQEIRRLVRAQP